MRIWLIKREEPVPLGERSGDRLLRMGTLAFRLADRGHEVVWWSSSFDHWRKRQRVEQDSSVRLSDRLELRLLKGCGYRANLSPGRFVDEFILTRKLRAWARRDDARPDVIVSALPSIELCRAAVTLGREMAVPVVLDMRDMWPDIFVELPPRPLRPLARLALDPLFRRAHRACAGATAITGITEAFVDWGVARAGRPRSSLDRCFPFGYASTPPAPERVDAAERAWDALGIPAAGVFTVGFVGSIDRQRDLATIIDGARQLASRHHDMRFVFCGVGERLEHFKRLSADIAAIVWAGWADAAAIYTLLRRAAVGLNPMPERFDYLASINNKAIEYLSAGVPIVSSPARGVLADLLAEQQCGASYPRGDVAAFTALLEGLREDGPHRARLSANASRVFVERFTADKVYGEMADYLEALAVRGPRNPAATGEVA